MTKEQIEAIRARCEAATPGRWEYIDVATEIWAYEEGAERRTVMGTQGMEYINIKDADADFIAHARTDIPALLAEVEQLREAQPVRCGECTYYYKGCCSHGVSDLTERKQDDYCSYGERKGSK